MKRDKHGRFVGTGGRKRGKRRNPVARLKTKQLRQKRKYTPCSFCTRAGLYVCKKCHKYLSCALHACDTRSGRVCPVCAAEERGGPCPSVMHAQEHVLRPRGERRMHGAVSARSLAMRGRYNPVGDELPAAPGENPYRRMLRTNASPSGFAPQYRPTEHSCGSCQQGFCSHCSRPSQRGCCCR